ncbi:hypothetical protein Tco_0257513 [Tanacetum coccineum]
MKMKGAMNRRNNAMAGVDDKNRITVTNAEPGNKQAQVRDLEMGSKLGNRAGMVLTRPSEWVGPGRQFGVMEGIGPGRRLGSGPVMLEAASPVAKITANPVKLEAANLVNLVTCVSG